MGVLYHQWEHHSGVKTYWPSQSYTASVMQIVVLCIILSSQHTSQQRRVTTRHGEVRPRVGLGDSDLGTSGFMGPSIAEFQRGLRELKSYFGSADQSGPNFISLKRKDQAIEITKPTTKMLLRSQRRINSQPKKPFTVFRTPSTTTSTTSKTQSTTTTTYIPVPVKNSGNDDPIILDGGGKKVIILPISSFFHEKNHEEIVEDTHIMEQEEESSFTVYTAVPDK